MMGCVGFGSGGLRCDKNVAAKVVESADQAADGLGAVTPIEVVGAEVVVLDPVTEHEVGSGEHRGRNGEDGLLGAAARLDAEELSTQVAVLDPYGRPGSGDQGGLEPVGALA